MSVFFYPEDTFFLFSTHVAIATRMGITGRGRNPAEVLGEAPVDVVVAGADEVISLAGDELVVSVVSLPKLKANTIDSVNPS